MIELQGGVIGKGNSSTEDMRVNEVLSRERGDKGSFQVGWGKTSAHSDKSGVKLFHDGPVDDSSFIKVPLIALERLGEGSRTFGTLQPVDAEGLFKDWPSGARLDMLSIKGFVKREVGGVDNIMKKSLTVREETRARGDFVIGHLLKTI